jgi:hypothetical protein
MEKAVFIMKDVYVPEIKAKQLEFNIPIDKLDQEDIKKIRVLTVQLGVLSGYNIYDYLKYQTAHRDRSETRWEFSRHDMRGLVKKINEDEEQGWPHFQEFSYPEKGRVIAQAKAVRAIFKKELEKRTSNIVMDYWY